MRAMLLAIPFVLVQLAMATSGDELANASAPAGTVAILPSRITGWQMVEEPQILPARDLWQHIDGGAEQYVQFGCTSLTFGYYGPATADGGLPPQPVDDSFASPQPSDDGVTPRQSAGNSITPRQPSDAEITVDVYRMDSDLGSFGLFELEKPARAERIDIGADGWQNTGGCAFWGGTLYVKIQGQPIGEFISTEAIRELAAEVATLNSTPSTRPSVLALLPSQNLVEGSLGFVPRAALGLTGMDRAITARYRASDAPAELSLHLIAAPDSIAARRLFATASESLNKRSAMPPMVERLGTGTGLRGMLKYYGPVLLLMTDSRVALAAGPIDADWALEIVHAALTSRPE